MTELSTMEQEKTKYRNSRPDSGITSLQAVADQQQGLNWTDFLDDDDEVEPVRTGSTAARRDEATMRAMGRRQLLERNFGLISMIGFTTTMMATWEAEALGLSAALTNGGNVSLVYGYILVFFGTLATTYSLAELASMFPTAGGQYHFVALLAPREVKNILSWMAGWMSLLAWQSGTASCAFLAATVTQGLLVLNYESYVVQRWHGTLILCLVIFIAVYFNTYLLRTLPFIESSILVCHICGYFVLLIPLVMFGPQSTAKFVFTDFQDRGGWDNGPLAWSIGLMSSAYPFLCYDGSCHMAEEVEDAARVVPRSMVATVVLNGIMGFGLLIAILFSMGSIDAALSTKTGYAIIEIVYNATESKSATNAIISILIAMSQFATIGVMAASSRLTWAFARDKGLPYSSFFSRIHPKRKVPFNSVGLTAAVCCLLSIINVVSTSAFNAMLSLAVVALYFTYLTPVVLILLLRLKHPASIQWGPFKMGRIAPFINVISICYTIYSSVFLMFPPLAETTAENMNWASLVCGVTFLFAVVSWYCGGKERYRGPLKEV